MRWLSECPVEGPGQVRKRREYWLVDRKDGADARRDPLTLIISSEENEFVVYSLDRTEIEWDGKRPDGVLVAELGGRSLICFIELKATMKGDPEVFGRAREQLRGGIMHFGPAGRFAGPRTHGDVHHDQWRGGEDRLLLVPARDHIVMGVVIAFRQLPPRIQPEEEQGAGKQVPMLLTSIPMTGYNRAQISLEALWAKLGLGLFPRK
jgi:hypothetical protein